MRRGRIVALTAFIAALFAHSVFSAQGETKAAQTASEAKAVPPKTEAANPRKELTKAEIIEHLKGNLDRMEEILNLIPGLNKETDPAGNVAYIYQGKSLEDLDKVELRKLYARVNNEAVRIRTEKLNKQLEGIRRANEITRQAQQVVPAPKIPAPPPNPPAIYTPPQPPSAAPPATTQPPKAPPVPATSPRR